MPTVVGVLGEISILLKSLPRATKSTHLGPNPDVKATAVYQQTHSAACEKFTRPKMPQSGATQLSRNKGVYNAFTSVRFHLLCQVARPAIQRLPYRKS